MNEARTIERLPVDSSNITSIGYAEDRQILAIQFKSGSLFHYRGVPLAVFEAFGAAPSRGSFFAKEIKGKFTSERMDGMCPVCMLPGLVGELCEQTQPSGPKSTPCPGTVMAFTRRKP